MGRMSRGRWIAAVALLGGCLLTGAGCDEYVAGQLAVLSGDYLGSVVSVVITHCLQDALGVEVAGNGDADGNDHGDDAAALHDHEH
jgi:hypothetical protein